MALHCELTCHALTEHLQQLYTGFALLHRSRIIRLSQRCSRAGVPVSDAQHLRNSGGAHLRVLLEGRLRLHYDAHDSYEIHEENLERCDFYFKRSFQRRYVESLPRHRAKVLPLGLHYDVRPDHPDAFAAARALRLGRGIAGKLRGLADALDAANLLGFRPRLRHLEAPPDPRLPARVLFLVNAYDPHDSPGRTPEKVEEYVRINEMRAACIRALREALGPRFYGGFTHNAYTVKRYPGLLAEEHSATRPRRYLALLRAYPIGVATTGLHGSIGWKFAEYVALSKAIVAERLAYEVPGGLEEGRHYLAFDSPGECVEKALRLVEDDEARIRLMRNNAAYYRASLRPDALVLNTLQRALSPLAATTFKKGSPACMAS